MKELDPILKEAFEKLIPIYEKAIEEMPKKGWLDWLECKDLCEGVCWASEYLFCVQIEDMVSDLGGRMDWWGFWGKTPSDCKTYTQAKRALQLRVNRMKKHL